MKTHADQRDMTNRKPFRTKAQKEAARASAKKVDGRWVSDAPVSIHSKPKGERS